MQEEIHLISRKIIFRIFFFSSSFQQNFEDDFIPNKKHLHVLNEKFIFMEMKLKTQDFEKNNQNGRLKKTNNL